MEKLEVLLSETIVPAVSTEPDEIILSIKVHDADEPVHFGFPRAQMHKFLDHLKTLMSVDDRTLLGQAGFIRANSVLTAGAQDFEGGQVLLTFQTGNRQQHHFAIDRSTSNELRVQMRQAEARAAAQKPLPRA